MSSQYTPPSASAPDAQAGLRDQVLSGLDRVDERIRALDRKVPAALRSRRRADGGWSIGELFEHMCLSNAAYLGPLHAAAEAPEAIRFREGAWRPAFVASLLTRALASPLPMRAPKVIQPGPVPRDGVVGALIATHDELRALIRFAEGLEWRDVRMTSPFAWFVRPNFGDACLIILRHSERHTGQAERLASSLGA